MKQFGFLIFLFVIILSSCSSPKQSALDAATNTPAPSKAPENTSTFTPEPTDTNTPTLAPTPMGGKKLSVAFISRDCETVNAVNCIAIADFFTERVLYRIPLNDATTETKFFWSPDGRYLMYKDINPYQVNFDIMLYDFVLTKSTVINSSPIEMPPSQTYKNGELVVGKFAGDNNLAAATWSADSKVVAYRTGVDSLSDRINIYTPASGENAVVEGFIHSYYWLDDNKSLVEIKTGQLYNAETKEMTTIPHESFQKLDVNTYSDSYIVSYNGENAAKTGEIYFYPYVTDRETLIEKGTKTIYDSEFLFAKFDYANQSRLPKISVHSLFLQGNSVIFSGTAVLFEPYEIHSYEYTGKISDVPFMLTLDDFSDEGYDNNSVMISISPDEKLYLTQQIFFMDSTTKQSFITVNDMETGEVLNTFDFHALGEEKHEIDYTNVENLAFYWEEE